MGVNYKNIDIPLKMFQNEFSRPGERPDNVPIEAIIKDAFGESNYELEQALSDMLDLIAFLESEKKNVRQGDLPSLTGRERKYHKGPGDGYYQFERGSRGGGYTRADQGYRQLPKELTPAWFHDQMVMAKSQDHRWTMENLDKDQQDFVMASYLLHNPESRSVIQSLSEGYGKSDGFVRRDVIINYWLDNHWAGWQTEENKKLGISEKVRKNKKLDAIKRINKDYQYNPNWLKLINNLDYEFNMDQMK